MTETLQVQADLDFSVEVDGAQMCGTLKGTGSHLELVVSDSHLLGGTGTKPARHIAQQLANAGLQLSITADRPLVTLGVPRTSYLQRRITGSPHIRVASLGAALRLLKLRRTSPERSALIPPPSPLPLLPTFLRRPRQPSTTHDPDRGGYPRLVTAPAEQVLPGEVRPVYALAGITTLGSRADSDIRMVFLQPEHAEIRQTEDDEFVLVPLVHSDLIRVNGGYVRGPALLRTGTRVEIGDRVLSFVREEYADHGRPYGGRVGGEIGHQKPQPPREALQ